MKIFEAKVMRRPYYWSTCRHKFTISKLHLQKLKYYPTHPIDRFSQRPQAQIPTLINYRFIEDESGIFSKHAWQKNNAVPIGESLAREIEKLAKSRSGFVSTCSEEKVSIFFASKTDLFIVTATLHIKKYWLKTPV
ncbi:hypothetical protein [Xanthocytophaga agilis]|uniref:Uncharacterized protein n=1 Tax=Xanthocytophaga agilis TaxID=3048010 RepID=A0AAE3RCF8_9BACT|nr:hypothetical protein [Xanthocytophaga agilis]MDJ1505902.1 hypothetical protein [Xanthocytophaga agilis]